MVSFAFDRANRGLLAETHAEGGKPHRLRPQRREGVLALAATRRREAFDGRLKGCDVVGNEE